MAIPSSGALALSAIQTEHGGSNPISLSEYYAGGANVPAGTSGTNGAVPSSGAISFSKFYGTSSATVSITNTSVGAVASSNSTALYTLNTSGIVQKNANGTITTYETWRLSGVSSAYDARATVTATNGSGTTQGTTGTWQNLATTRSWGVNVNGSAGQNGTRTMTIEIRNASTLVVLDSASITFSSQTV